jgi:protein HOOK3
MDGCLNDRDRQKSEENLAMAEAELDKQTSLLTELTRKVDELQGKADEAVKLKDQVDEYVFPLLSELILLFVRRYRHAADKLQKTENVMEKYKKKLQEGADLRQHVKALEKQNASLVDKNAALEEEYRKVSAFKPLMESYKTQIFDLEAKGSAKSQEMERLAFELDDTRNRLKVVMSERAKDAEALELYQERVRELELSTTARSRVIERAEVKSPGVGPPNESVALLSELSVSAGQAEEYDEEGVPQGLEGELDDAITGTTMTDLKLQIRRLQRELAGVKKNEADASRILVLENLLEDANRMKARYEQDYLAAHREKLILMRDLEEIRNGSKGVGDG